MPFGPPTSSVTLSIWPRLAVDAIDGFLGLLLALEAFVVSADAVGRIGEPDAAVGMHDDVVRRVQALALKLLRDHGHGAVRLVAHDAASAMLAGQLAAFVIERVAVAVAGWIAEHRDAAVVFDPAHLDVVRNVAPHQVAADAVPRRPFRPQRADVQPLDGRVADDVAAEARIERDDVRVGILHRLLPRPVARRRDGRHLRLRRLRCRRRDRGGSEGGGQKRSSIPAAAAGWRALVAIRCGHGGYVYRTCRSDSPEFLRPSVSFNPERVSERTEITEITAKASIPARSARACSALKTL